MNKYCVCVVRWFCLALLVLVSAVDVALNVIMCSQRRRKTQKPFYFDCIDLLNHRQIDKRKTHAVSAHESLWNLRIKFPHFFFSLSPTITISIVRLCCPRTLWRITASVCLTVIVQAKRLTMDCQKLKYFNHTSGLCVSASVFNLTTNSHTNLACFQQIPYTKYE